MKVQRTIDKEKLSDAYGVHVKDAYELVKMYKKPVHNDLGKLPKYIRKIFYSSSKDKFYGVHPYYPDIELDISQLQPLFNQLVESETPYDKERFKTFTLDVSPERYKEWCLNKKCSTLDDIIALDDSLTKIVGYIRFNICETESAKTLYVFNFVVDESYRGHGIGKELLKRCENIAFNTKCDFITLSCYRINKAIKLYKSLGFKEVDLGAL